MTIPAATPVTIPVTESIDAIATLLLVHLPPDAVSANWVVALMQTDAAPLIAPTTGIAPTVIGKELELEQPVPLVTV